MDINKIEQEMLANIISFGKPSNFALIRKIVSVDDFSNDINKNAWRVICSIDDKCEAIDATRAFVEAKALGIDNDEAIEIASMTANRVRDDLQAIALDIAVEAKKRMIVNILIEAQEQAYSTNDPYHLAEDIRKKLDEVSKRREGVQDYCSLYKEVLANMDLVLNGEAPEQVFTGFKYIDNKGGLKPGDLDIIAGRTSNGKTAFSMAIAENVASRGVAVGVFSMEMTNIEICKRIIAMQTEVPCRQVDRPDDVRYLQEVIERGRPETPLYFDNSNSTNVDDIISRMREMSKELSCKVFVVDYLQQLTKKGADKRTIVSEASVALKNAAKELGVTIIALSQLARCDDPVPHMHQLKESGEIENSADNVYLIYRAEIYKGKEFFPAPHDSISTKGLAMVYNTKSRSGELGEFIVGFKAEIVKYFDAHVDETNVNYDVAFANERKKLPF